MSINLIVAIVGAAGALLMFSALTGLFTPKSDSYFQDQGYRMRSLRDRPVLDRLIGPAASDAAGLLARLGGNQKRDERRLVQAGFPPPFETIGDFYGWKVILAFGLFLSGLALAALLGSAIFLIAALGLGLFGLYLPDISLHQDAMKRQEMFRIEMAFTLDRLALFMHAGEIPENAIRHVAQRGGGLFIQELRAVVNQLNTGETLTDALATVLERFPLDDYEQFLSVVMMSVESGTGLYQVLGTMSGNMQSELENDLLAKGTSSTLAMVLGMGLALLGIVVVIGGPALYMFLAGGSGIM